MTVDLDYLDEDDRDEYKYVLILMWAINKSLSVLCSRSPKTWIFLGNAFWEILAVHLCQGFSVATP